MTADVSMSQSSGQCPSCPHPVREHSQEPGVGCLHVRFVRSATLATLAERGACPCTEPGTSGADQ